MSKELNIRKDIDNNLQNIKADQESTPINVSKNKVQVDGNLDVTGNFQASMESLEVDTLNSTTINTTTINSTTINNSDKVSFGTGATIDSPSDRQLDINSNLVLVTAADNALEDETCSLQLLSIAGADCSIILREGVSTQRYIAIDADDGDKLKIGMGATVGSSASITLDSHDAFHEGSVSIKEKAAAISDTAAYGQLWVKTASPNLLYFTNDEGTDIQLTTADAVNASGGGGGTSRWSFATGGYKVNNNSSSFYYFQYRPNNDGWNNSENSPTTINQYDAPAAQWIAPAAGTLTNITVQGYVSDTGATDPFKFYVFKGQSAHDGTSTSLTQIGATNAITAAASLRNFRDSTDISSSNTFSEGDALWVMLKKDSTSGNQDLYFSVTISGEYS